MKKSNKYLVCSECFNNYGLQQEAMRLGKQSREKCPHCNSKTGYLLT